MPGKILAKIVRIGYVGQVVTAGVLLTVAVLVMFAVVGTLEPSAKPPAIEIAPVAEMRQQAQVIDPNSRLADQGAPPVPPTTAAVDIKITDGERKLTLDNQVVSQLWQGKVTHDFGWQLHPVYQDWRYHDGIDISGGEGQIVPALAAGEVLEIYTDKKYGLTVVVKNDQYIINYSSLASAVVQSNTKIEVGRPVGSMGIILSEPEPHLHLAVQMQGSKEYCNPREIFPNIPE